MPPVTQAFGTKMDILRLKPIKGLRAIDKINLNDSINVKCLDGRAKWIPTSHILSIKVHFIVDGSEDDVFLEFISKSQNFDLEVITDSMTACTRFKVVAVDEIECRSGTGRPQGPFTMNYYMKFIAEQVICVGPGKPRHF
jgi:hypothetical protein